MLLSKYKKNLKLEINRYVLWVRDSIIPHWHRSPLQADSLAAEAGLEHFYKACSRKWPTETKLQSRNETDKARGETWIDGVIEGITDHGNVASVALLDPLDVQLEELGASRLINQGCDEKDEHVPEKMMVTNFTLKKTTEMVPNIENTNNNIVEAKLPHGSMKIFLMSLTSLGIFKIYLFISIG